LRSSCYRGSVASRLPRLSALAGALALALACGGCSYQLDSLGKSKADDGDITGSIQTSRIAKPIVEPAEADLAIARAAASEVLAKGGKDASMPWENPQTGARGTVTPIAQAYSQDGLTCHDFLASYVRNGSESWLQGEACRQGRGRLNGGSPPLSEI
jgi:surface antigen